MKKRQRYKLIEKYPILVGLVLIIALMSVLLFQKYWSERPEGQWTVLTNDLAREGTIEQFQNPEDLIKYTVAALKKEDLDMLLRACSIDEKLLSNPFYTILDREKKFGYEMVLPPSANYEEYRPLSSAILTKYYTDQYDFFQKQVKKLGAVKLEKVGVLYPQKQLDAETLSETTRSCNEWGASIAVQMTALLQTDQGHYMISFTVTKHYGYWKIFDFGAEIMNMENGQFLTATNPKEFDDTIGKTDVMSFLKTLDNEIAYGKDVVKKKTDEESEKNVVVKHPEKEILPSNYFIVGASYGKEQKDTIQKFVMAIQKKDPIKALSYCNMDNAEKDLNTVTSQRINTQANYARQLSYFYYSLLGEPYFQGEKTLAGLNQTAAGILERINPQFIPYMYSDEILKVTSGEDSKEEQYVAFYSLNGKRYMAGYTLIKLEKGWQILSLSAPEKGLEPGEVKEITWKQYQKMLGKE
jgi:hypothetical protein